MNTVPSTVWLLLEPHTVKSWGNSDSGLSAQPSRGGQALNGAGLVQAAALQPSRFPPETRQGAQATVASPSNLAIHALFPDSTCPEAVTRPPLLGPGMALLASVFQRGQKGEIFGSSTWNYFPFSLSSCV